MRLVLVVLTDGFAGVERYVCQVARGMAARGNSVTVVGGAPGRMVAELDPAVAHVPAAGLAAGALALARQGRADVVHVHMTAAEVAAWLAGPANRAPVVATRHFARERGSSPPARAAARLASRSIAAEVAISRFVAQAVAGPTRLVHPGVADRPAAPLEARTVVMLQRLDHEKSGDVGLRAWARSGLGAEGWRLAVAGEGRRRHELEGLARDLGVAGTVDFLGAVADTDALLQRSSVLLAPAPAEPFGLSVVEAMANGLPVVAAAGGGHLETVGDDGVLFAPGDAEAAAGHLRELAADPSARRRAGARLRRRQQERFGLGRHLDELEAVYREVVAASRPQRAPAAER